MVLSLAAVNNDIQHSRKVYYSIDILYTSKFGHYRFTIFQSMEMTTKKDDHCEQNSEYTRTQIMKNCRTYQPPALLVRAIVVKMKNDEEKNRYPVNSK